MRLRPPTLCETARLFPSGDQSASFTLSRISRGAPPDSGTRASVPGVPLRRAAEQDRQFPGETDRKDSGGRKPERARLAPAQPRGKNRSRLRGPLCAEQYRSVRGELALRRYRRAGRSNAGKLDEAALADSHQCSRPRPAPTRSESARRREANPGAESNLTKIFFSAAVLESPIPGRGLRSRSSSLPRSASAAADLFAGTAR